MSLAASHLRDQIAIPIMRETMKSLFIAFSASAIFFSAAADEKTASPLEIRFCPSSAVRTYPLESRRDLQSLMLQNVAIINHGEAPFKIDDIEIELLKAGQVLDSKNLMATPSSILPNVGRKCRRRACWNKSPSNFAGMI